MLTANDAADLIETIAESFQRDSSQFHYELNVTQFGGSGTNIANQRIEAPTDTVIGFQAAGEFGQAQIIQAKQVTAEHVGEMVQTLRSMATELRADKPDKGQLRKWIEMLRDRAAPGAIVAVVRALVSAI